MIDVIELAFAAVAILIVAVAVTMFYDPNWADDFEDENEDEDGQL